MDGFNLSGSAQNVKEKPEMENQDEESMVFDLSTVSDEGPAFEVLPKGTYNAIVEELEFALSQSSNAPMIHATYSIIDPEFEARKIHDYYTLTGKGAEYSLPRLKQLLTRVCPEVPLTGFNAKEFADSGVAINRQCQLKLVVQTQKKGDYKGEKRNSVREILSSSELSNSFLG